MDKINVLYCFDSKTWRMAAVSIESLIANTKNSTQLAVYCMVRPGTEGHKKIKKIVKSYKSNAKLIWREIKSHENPFEKGEFSKWDPIAFYRLIAHRFFKNIDKILYLSTDTLIFHDLSELFKTDISQHVFAAVCDMAQINNPDNSLGVSIKQFSTEYLNNGPYYNSGVLLVNLKNLKAHEHLMFESKVPLRFPEQDLLNVAFVGKIKTLPLKYNLAPGIGVPSHFSQQEATEINLGNHVIINCYYDKAYDKSKMNKLVYDAFEKSAKHIGMTPEMFMNQNQPIKKTFVPFVKTRGDTILFFGKEIT